MCFSSPKPPGPVQNPAGYALDQSHTKVEQTVTPASSEELKALEPEAAQPSVPLRTATTGIYYKQG